MDREFRRSRILAMASAGWRHAAIGREGAIARERLLTKLNAMAETVKRRRELHGAAPPGEDDSPIAQAALAGTESHDFIDDPAAPSSAGLDIA
jgi:hypothetical protein